MSDIIEKKSKFISNISSNLSNEDDENNDNFDDYENFDVELYKKEKICEEISTFVINYVTTTKNHTIIPLCEYLNDKIVLDFIEKIELNKKSLLYYLNDE